MFPTKLTFNMVVSALTTIIKWTLAIMANPPDEALNLGQVLKILRNKSSDQLVAEARQRLGMDMANHFNFAIVGHSGVGKSTLINRFRQLSDDDEDAAEVGEIETTQYIRRYPNPSLPHIMLWDIPGAGTLRHPEATYFEDNMLYAFDCILILSANRFQRADFNIARKAMEYGRPCAFVRAKADLAIRALAERGRKSMRDASQEFRVQMDESFQKGISEAGFRPQTYFPLFIVSSWAFTKTDAYTLKTRRGNADTSLDKMDEDQLFVFITNSVRARRKWSIY